MMKKQYSESTDIFTILHSREVMTLPEIQEVLGNVSKATAFRRLAAMDYRSSYNFNGRYYSVHDIARYDRHGLWSHKGIRFSLDGSLTATVRRLVRESESGHTQRELQQLLGVRVQNVATALMKRSDLVRERIGETFVYLHPARRTRLQQIACRRQQLADTVRGDQEVSLDVVVDILLVLIRHPGSEPAAVARRLRRRSPPIGIEQVKWVFGRYRIGEKKGLSRS
jgi:hypothetical protein